MPLDHIRVSGLTPFSTVDYPGRISAVIFCQGCPWRCRYCHNPHLQPFNSGLMQWQDIEAFLRKRRGVLDAVVFSGGEPTAQPGLEAAMQSVRSMGYLVGLHTAGILPGRLRSILPLVNWVGLDIKAPFDQRYDAITRGRASWKAARASLHEILAEKVDYQIRTTVHPALLPPAARESIQNLLTEAGASPSHWQEFRVQGCLDEELNQIALSA